MKKKTKGQLPKKSIEKQLNILFQYTTPSYKLEGSNLCHECEEMHLELERGRQITLDDIEVSCYKSLFYDNQNTFEFLIPFLLIKAMNLESDLREEFPKRFLQELRAEDKLDWFTKFSKPKKEVIVEALRYIHGLYLLNEYEFWDFNKEMMVYYDTEKVLEEEVRYTLRFWQEING